MVNVCCWMANRAYIKIVNDDSCWLIKNGQWSAMIKLNKQLVVLDDGIWYPYMIWSTVHAFFDIS